MSETKVPLPMSTIFYTYNRAHNVLELVDILPNFFSQQVKRNVTIANKNFKYQSTDELRSDVRLKKISKIHGVIL